MREISQELKLLAAKFETDGENLAEGAVRIRILPQLDVLVDFHNYPKPPLVQIPAEMQKIVGKPKDFLFSLMQWKKKRPFHVVSVVEELRNHVENVAGIKVRILLELAKGLCEQARHYHPREFLGLLRVKGGVLAEFLLTPGMQSSAISAVYFPQHLSHDRSIIASVHSHPSGNARPSDGDLHSYASGTNLLHLIIGYPYNLGTICAFDRRGSEIPLEVVTETPFEIKRDAAAVLDDLRDIAADLDDEPGDAGDDLDDSSGYSFDF